MTISKNDNTNHDRSGRIIEVPLTMAEIAEMDMWLFRLRETRKKKELEEEKHKE